MWSFLTAMMSSSTVITDAGQALVLRFTQYHLALEPEGPACLMYLNLRMLINGLPNLEIPNSTCSEIKINEFIFKESVLIL